MNKSLIGCLLVAALPYTNAIANPSGEQVTAGQASFERNGNRLTVTNTPGTQINWRQFSIGANETTHFAQKNAASTVFNRVTGTEVSRILGTLSSNGRVFLANPNGVLFGEGAVINVQALIASTLDWRTGSTGQLEFFKNPSFAGQGEYAGKIINQGSITSGLGGEVWLIGENVRNNGVIRADRGRVLLAAGEKVTLGDTAAPELTVTIDAKQSNQAVNIGQIYAQGGVIDMFGALLEQQGLINVDTAVVDAQGRIRLSSTQATNVSGEISAKSSAGLGGNVRVLSEGNVQLSANALIDASGKSGGGTVLVGGDWQGNNPHVINAANTQFAKGARIYADATDNGNGGKVVLWSNNTTDFKGTISANGGINGGNGGNVETSGKQHLLKGGYVSTGSWKGQAGQWLIDPAKLCFQNSSANSCAGLTAAEIWTNADMLAAVGGSYSGGNTAPVTTNGRLVFSATDTIDIYALDLSNAGFANKKIDFEVTGATGVINVRGAITAPQWTQNLLNTQYMGPSTPQVSSPPTGTGPYTFNSTVMSVETYGYADALDLALKGNTVNIVTTGGSIDKAFVHIGANTLDGATVAITTNATPPAGVTNSPAVVTKIFNTAYTAIINNPGLPAATDWVAGAKTENTAARNTTTLYEQTTYTFAATADTATAVCSADATSVACENARNIVSQAFASELLRTDPVAYKEMVTKACDNGDTTVCSALTLASNSTLSALATVSNPLTAISKSFTAPAGATREQLTQAQQERKEAKTALLSNSLGILQRRPDAADVPTCGTGASDACVPNPQDTLRRALSRSTGLSAGDNPSSTAANTTGKIQRKVALLIAVNAYQSSDIPKLEAPIRDVDAIGAELTNRLGYSVQTLKNASKDDIVRALRSLAENANIDDSVIVYYAGHGYQRDDGSQGYWLPTDAGVDNPGKWISNRDIARMLEATHAKQLMLVADSCYSGSLTKGQGANASIGSKSINELLGKRSVVVLTSGGEEPVSDEGLGGHSVFAWSFLNNLKRLDNTSLMSENFDSIKKEVSATYPQVPQYLGLAAANSAPGADYLLQPRAAAR